MEKGQIYSFIQRAVEALGPSITEEKVDFGDGNVEKCLFRRLPFLEIDRLRLHAINAEGKFDKSLHVGAAARFVAASLCDDSGTPVYSYDEVAAFPTPIVDKLNEAAQAANGMTPVAKEEIAKK